MLYIKINDDLQLLEQLVFPSGEKQLNLKPDVLKNLGISTVVWKYVSNEDSLLELLQLKMLFEQNNITSPKKLVIPYLPFARMDRVKDNSQCFSLKMIANLINELNFGEVELLDVHSDVSLDLIKNSVRTTFFTQEFLLNELKIDPKRDVLVFPDEGAYKRYISLYPAFDNVYHGVKQRNFDTGKIEGISLHHVKGWSEPTSKVYVIDDICSYGGTFVGIRKAMTDFGLNFNVANLIITHCEYNIHKGNVLNTYDYVYTTDSIYNDEVPYDKMHVFVLSVRGGL